MTAEPKWISRKALLLLHEESLAEFGGARGLRDEGLLHSALARPQMRTPATTEPRSLNWRLRMDSESRKIMLFSTETRALLS